MQGHGDLLGAFHHVVVGDDVAVGGEDDAAAGAAEHLLAAPEVVVGDDLLGGDHHNAGGHRAGHVGQAAAGGGGGGGAAAGGRLVHHRLAAVLAGHQIAGEAAAEADRRHQHQGQHTCQHLFADAPLLAGRLAAAHGRAGHAAVAGHLPGGAAPRGGRGVVSVLIETGVIIFPFVFHKNSSFRVNSGPGRIRPQKSPL